MLPLLESNNLPHSVI